MNENDTMIELTDAELNEVSGGGLLEAITYATNTVVDTTLHYVHKVAKAISDATVEY